MKLPDWEDRLTALIQRSYARKFVRGEFDCCLWAAEVVEAQTGVDHGAEYRGTYCDADGANRIIRRLRGLRGIASVVGPEIPPLTARNGDVGLVRSNCRPLLALCTGTVWLAVSSSGLVTIDYRAALKAWRVHG